MMEKSTIDWVGMILVIIGALNWGLVGLSTLINSATTWNIVNMIFGKWPMFEAIVYVLVGLSGIWMLVKLFK
jgi:hypothetical protein